MERTGEAPRRRGAPRTSAGAKLRPQGGKAAQDYLDDLKQRVSARIAAPIAARQGKAAKGLHSAWEAGEGLRCRRRRRGMWKRGRDARTLRAGSKGGPRGALREVGV